MLEWLFTQVLDLSLTGSIVILYVLVGRLLLRKCDKVFSYCLWAVVLIRLLCPVATSDKASVAVGVVPDTTVVAHTITEAMAPTYLPNFSHVTVDEVVQTETETTKATTNWLAVASIVWLVGVVSLLGYGFYGYLMLRIKLIGYRHFKENIYYSETVTMPFVIGIFTPKIFLPTALTRADSDFNYDTDFVIEHERHHIRRLDHITRLLAYFTVAVHWFNPLVWLAFGLSESDMEQSCDQYVLKKRGALDVEVRREYSHSLLYFADKNNSDKRLLSATPKAFGDVDSKDTKERITNIMRYKKPILAVSGLGAIIVLAGFIGLSAPTATEKAGSPEDAYAGMSPVSQVTYQTPEQLAGQKADQLEREAQFIADTVLHVEGMAVGQTFEQAGFAGFSLDELDFMLYLDPASDIANLWGGYGSGNYELNYNIPGDEFDATSFGKYVIGGYDSFYLYFENALGYNPEILNSTDFTIPVTSIGVFLQTFDNNDVDGFTVVNDEKVYFADIESYKVKVTDQHTIYNMTDVITGKTVEQRLERLDISKDDMAKLLQEHANLLNTLSNLEYLG